MLEPVNCFPQSSSFAHHLTVETIGDEKVLGTGKLASHHDYPFTRPCQDLYVAASGHFRPGVCPASPSSAAETNPHPQRPKSLLVHCLETCPRETILIFSFAFQSGLGRAVIYFQIWPQSSRSENSSQWDCLQASVFSYFYLFFNRPVLMFIMNWNSLPRALIGSINVLQRHRGQTDLQDGLMGLSEAVPPV